MKLIDQIEFQSGKDVKRIQLLKGDLTRIPREHYVDALVVSAFPSDYSEVPGTVIGALGRAGLSVSALSEIKEFDLRKQFSCWLSPQIGSKVTELNFSRVLCFEPAVRGRAPEVVGDIFRAIAPFVCGDPPIRRLAMPIVAAGNQMYSVREVFPPLLDAAIHWLNAGLPISEVKIVAYSDGDAEIARSIFQPYASKHSEYISQDAPSIEFDAFLSYSRADKSAASLLREQLESVNMRVFIDSEGLNPGSSWQQKIFEAIEASNRVVTILSDDYVRSKVCQEEFNLAFALQRKRSKDTLFPVLWRRASLPLYMEMVNYLNCAEADPMALRNAGDQLLTELRRNRLS